MTQRRASCRFVKQTRNLALRGIARCATVIRHIREHEKSVLLVDASDTMQGTPVSFLTDDQVMVKHLNELHYNSWTWRNHEFNWGLMKDRRR